MFMLQQKQICEIIFFLINFDFTIICEYNFTLFIALFLYLQNIIIEFRIQQMSQSSLSLKLQLLRTLKTGNIEQIHNLISKIKDVTKVNPQLYEKFNSFVTQNKDGLLQMQKEQKEENEPTKIIIENVDGELSDDDYNSDESWSLESQSQQQQEKQKSQGKPKQNTILKEGNNKQNIKAGNTINTKKEKQPQKVNPQLAFKKQTSKPTKAAQIQKGLTKTRS